MFKKKIPKCQDFKIIVKESNNSLYRQIVNLRSLKFSSDF